MFTLALDCSTSRGSVALGRGTEDFSRVVWHAEFHAGRGCGGEMFTALQNALREIEATDERLGSIVVGLGPGSYSGVRQAIAAATGLAAATGAPLRGVPSVAALLPPGSGPFHAAGDARRGTFYYTAVRDGTCIIGPELLVGAVELTTRVRAHPDWPVYVVESPLPEGLFPDAEIRLPDAVGLLAAPISSRQSPPLEPIYLRPVSITLPKAVKTSDS